MKIKLGVERLYPTKSFKRLGVKIVPNLNLKYHVNDLSIKLNRANALLFNMRKYVSLKKLRSIYFVILIPTYPTTVFPGVRFLALFNEF